MRKFFNSFRFALAGIVFLFRTQRNARLQALAAIIVSVAGFVLHVSVSEWGLLFAAIAAVIAAEGFNTAVEVLADRVTLERDEKIRRAKDISAAAVLIASAGAAAIGIVIFGPRVAALF
ncbi:MAG: diacylglycerol kinase family protein [Nibricoccus sp.]